MSSKLLPSRTQVATLRCGVRPQACSNLSPMGSRWVAGWVAGWIGDIRLPYGVERGAGSRCSTFLNKLRVKGSKGGGGCIGVTIGISCYTCYPGKQVPLLGIGSMLPIPKAVGR